MHENVVRGTRADESLCVHGKSTETRLCVRGTPAHAQNSVLDTIRVKEVSCQIHLDQLSLNACL